MLDSRPKRADRIDRKLTWKLRPSTMEVARGLPEPTGVVGAVEWVESGARALVPDAGSLMDDAEALEMAPPNDGTSELDWGAYRILMETAAKSHWPKMKMPKRVFSVIFETATTFHSWHIWGNYEPVKHFAVIFFNARLKTAGNGLIRPIFYREAWKGADAVRKILGPLFFCPGAECLLGIAYHLLLSGWVFWFL